MESTADDLTQKQMLRQVWEAVVPTKLPERFAILEAEHVKRAQNCPLLISIQNGKQARQEGQEHEAALRVLDESVDRKFEKFGDKLEALQVKVAGIAAGAVIVNGLVFWLFQR